MMPEENNQNALIVARTEKASSNDLSEALKGPEPSISTLQTTSENEVFADLPPLSIEPRAPETPKIRSCSFGSVNAEAPPGRLTQIPPGAGCPHGSSGTFANDTNSDHLQSDYRILEHDNNEDGAYFGIYIYIIQSTNPPFAVRTNSLSPIHSCLSGSIPGPSDPE